MNVSALTGSAPARAASSAFSDLPFPLGMATSGQVAAKTPNMAAPRGFRVSGREFQLQRRLDGGPTRTRTWNQTVMSRQL